MEPNSTSDASSVSGGAENPTPGASSGAVAETQPPPAPAPEPAQPQPQPASGAETVGAESGDEFPDDAAFQALPGEERASNWQRARARIAELNNRVRELDGHAAQYTELGDLEQLKTDAELARSLFSFAQDEEGNTVYDPQTGLPAHSTAEFVSRLQEGSPAVANQLFLDLWGTRGADGLTGAQRMFQSLGLNPQLLEVYRSIQSPQDAAQYAPQAVDPAELTGISPELHEAYKSFSAEDRYDLQQLAERDERRFLARLSERKEHLENQKFIAEARQRDEQLKQEQQQRWKQEIEQKTLSRGQAKQDQTVKSQLEQLRKQYSPFGPDDNDGNEMVYADVLSFAEKALSTPELQQKTQTAWHQYYLHEYYTATGDQMLAARALADAEKLALELQREFNKAATRRVEQWNNRLKNRIVAAPGPSQQHNPNPAQPTTPSQTPNGAPQYREPGRFGLSQSRINEIAAQLAMEKARATG